jgi:hypothetical protein
MSTVTLIRLVVIGFLVFGGLGLFLWARRHVKRLEKDRRRRFREVREIVERYSGEDPR